MVKYSWAKYNNKIVHINDVTIEMRKNGSFFNLISNKKMTAYLEGKFKPHFHHLNKVNFSNETYLHEAAKEVFKETYLDAVENKVPFYLEYPIKAVCDRHFKQTDIFCNIGTRTEAYDLTKTFDKIKVEEGFDEFKPDIQLLSTKKPTEVIFIEIVVTHKSTSKKLNSRNKIIEITIKNDSDVIGLKNKRLSFEQNNTEFYNFKLNSTTRDFCSLTKKGCREYRKVFILNKNGSYEFTEYYLESILAEIYSNQENIKFVDYHLDKFYNERKTESENQIEYLNYRNIQIRECELCRYAGYSRRRINKKEVRLSLFCKFKKELIQSENALSCEYFRTKDIKTEHS
ncbi:hypothetical protein WJN01_01540 [Flavobacteriaceae bacterium SZ-1-7]|uniref:hypothetical protein n=1 Tax=Tamlana sedimenti TaxID=3134126 RepID=UPI003121B50D